MSDDFFLGADSFEEIVSYCSQYVAWGIGLALIAFISGYVLWFIWDVMRH